MLVLCNIRKLFFYPDNPDAGFDFTKYELSVGWSRITVNRGLFPTAGSRQTLNLTATTPNSDLQYFKLNYDSRFYWPISNDHRWVFSTRAALGYGNGYGSTNGYEQTLPFQEYFRITEMELRGFDRNTILPQAVSRIATTIPGTLNPDGSTSGPINSASEFDQLIPQGRIGGNAKAVAGMELIDRKSVV